MNTHPDRPSGRARGGRSLALSGATVLTLGLGLGAGVLSTGATADTTPDPLAAGASAASVTTQPTLPTTTTDTTTTGTTTTGTTTSGAAPVDGAVPGLTVPTDPNALPEDSDAPDPAAATVSPPVPDPALQAVPVDPAALDPSGDQAVRPISQGDTGVPTPTATPSVRTHRHATPRTLPSTSRGAAAKPALQPARGGTSLARPSALEQVAQQGLLPTPSQIRFFVEQQRVAPLPKLETIRHGLAVRLSVVAKEHRVGWTLLAAVAKRESDLGRAHGPIAARRVLGATSTATQSQALGALATYLHDHGATSNALRPRQSREALVAYYGNRKDADRTVALAALYGALGRGGLQHGLAWDVTRLQRRVLRDHRVSIYDGGRTDIRGGRVDGRVLLTMEYLANAEGRIKVSCLIAGHSLFTTSGSVSAHVYGRAVDISAVRGRSIAGHQGPGTVTEASLRYLLMEPRALRARQLISLMDMDGPTANTGSFAMPDHWNHIHVGF